MGSTASVPLRRRIRKPAAAMALAALGGVVTFAIREVLTDVNERRQIPMIVTIEPHEAAYADGFEVAFGSGFDESTFEAQPGCAEMHEYLALQGGVDVGATFLLITLQGTTDRAVSVEGMRLEVAEPATPVADVFIECRSGNQGGGSSDPSSGGSLGGVLARSTGYDELGGVSIDIDAPADGHTITKSGISDETFLSDSSLTIQRGETVKLLLHANTCGCKCAWRIVLDLLVDGEQQDFVLLSERPPFRTTGEVQPETKLSWTPDQPEVQRLEPVSSSDDLASCET